MSARFISIARVLVQAVIGPESNATPSKPMEHPCGIIHRDMKQILSFPIDDL